MRNPQIAIPWQQIDNLVVALDSIIDGDLAVDMLISCGKCAIPPLAKFLLQGYPRTVSLPRCRAARALGELGARSTLISYFKEYTRPLDASVLFAEDAVRSAAAQELARWKSDEVFEVLLDAAWQRTTGGLVLALGEFHRPESIPLLFEVLEDDLCREYAKESLLKMPDATRQFCILAIRGFAIVKLEGPSAVCRRRATLQLLHELGCSPDDWPDLRRFLRESDPGTLIPTAQIGFLVAPESEQSQILMALLRVAQRLNYVQEEDVTQLLDAHPTVSREVARQMVSERSDQGERLNWLSPFWRMVQHLLGESENKN